MEWKIAQDMGDLSRKRGCWRASDFAKQVLELVIVRYREGTRLEGASSVPPSISLEVAIESFLGHHRRKGSGQRYLEELASYLIGAGQRRGWMPLLPWAKGAGLTVVVELRRDAVEQYLDTVRAAATLNTYTRVCGILAKFLRHLVDEEHLASLPLQIVQPKRLQAQIAVFTDYDVRCIRDVVRGENVRDWAIFMLLVDTGLRAGELCALRLDDLHLERREIVVRASIAKSKRSRILPLGASLSPLRRYLKLRGDSTQQCGSLFLSFYSTPAWAGGPHRAARQHVNTLSLSASPLTRTGIYQLIRTWGRLAAIKEARCSPHTFRHYFATAYLRRGGDIVTLQRILGHARLSVTERYLAITERDVKASHERFSPAAGLVSPRTERLRRGSDG